MPVSALAIEHNVSRPTVYRQMERAIAAIDELFAPAPCADEQILFTLPVTDRCLRQVMLALTMVGHVSFATRSN